MDIIKQAFDEYAALEKRGAIANPYRAGRSMAVARNGMVASSHALASQTGLDVLKDGGNAMDSGIAMAAVLGVVEPMMTGLGGDAFFLYYEASSKKVYALNGSGRSPHNLSRSHFDNKEAIDQTSWEAVTVPGTVDAWCEGLDRFGSSSLEYLLKPAIHYAEDGFPLTETVSLVWRFFEDTLKNDPQTEKIYLKDGHAPPLGTVFKNPALAASLKAVADGGRDAFYRGPLAEEIVRYSSATGGFLSMRDFEDHTSIRVTPISSNYRGFDVYQTPPNGQGLGVLLMLNILEGYDIGSMKLNSPEYLHLIIEAKKLAYADLDQYVSGSENDEAPLDFLLSKQYAKKRRQMIDLTKPADDVPFGLPDGSDTVYLTAIDKNGNAVSFINSIFTAFGSTIVGGETGILLQNRGFGFTLEKGHPNEYAPHKRPYHTIIPGMILKNGDLYMSYGLMGGAMQPQGQVQFLLNHLDFGLNIQEAMDAPRLRHINGSEVRLEHGITMDAMLKLRDMGHEVYPGVGMLFGGAQAILVDHATGTYFGGSDPRKDGSAIGY